MFVSLSDLDSSCGVVCGVLSMGLLSALLLGVVSCFGFFELVSFPFACFDLLVCFLRSGLGRFWKNLLIDVGLVRGQLCLLVDSFDFISVWVLFSSHDCDCVSVLMSCSVCVV